MIVLPNDLERYIASLRVFVSLLIFKNGLTQKHLNNLKKIYKCESFLNKKFCCCVNINVFTTNLLRAISDINPRFTFECDCKGNFLLNKNLLTLLILKLSKEFKEIKLKTFKNQILITVPQKTNSCLSVINALKGHCLFEIKSNRFLIIIPLKETCEKPIKTESEWEYLFNQFSPLNIFFNRIL